MLNEGMFAGSPGMVLKPEGRSTMSLEVVCILITSYAGYRGKKAAAVATLPTQAQDSDLATQAVAIPHKTLDLAITILAARSIPLPHGDGTHRSFRPYVKVDLHVEEPAERRGGRRGGVEGDGLEKEGEYKARTKTYKGCDSDFGGETLEFKGIPGVVEELAFVRLLVKDDELMRDDLAAWACVRLDRLRKGYRFVHLLDSRGQETEGVILVKVAKSP